MDSPLPKVHGTNEVNSVLHRYGEGKRSNMGSRDKNLKEQLCHLQRILCPSSFVSVTVQRPGGCLGGNQAGSTECVSEFSHADSNQRSVAYKAHEQICTPARQTRAEPAELDGAIALLMQHTGAERLNG